MAVDHNLDVFVLEPTPLDEATHLVYLDLAFGLILNLPSVVDPRLYACFTTLTVTANPNARAEINFRSGIRRSTPSAEWNESHWALIEALAAHRSFVTLTLTKMAFYPEARPMVLGMKRYDVVMEIVSISASFTEDCAFLDPILLACWTETIFMVDHSIQLGPEDVVQNMHLPTMASVIRQRSRTLKQGLPSSVNQVDDV
ncbi:hypothetical protein C8R44DRAFT_895899 [Mycena epipterygia]|nr:hypothetical protein C8R44DRAFT_895899 [Mycena epipterygia]